MSEDFDENNLDLEIEKFSEETKYYNNGAMRKEYINGIHYGNY